MLPEDYVIYESYYNACFMCILDSGDETWLLGDAFLRGFYSTHDHKEKRFGFAPHSLSTKKGAQKGQEPLTELPVVLSETDWIIIGVTLGVVLVAIILLIYFLIYPPAAITSSKVEV
jgi:hypothetical protein